MARVHAVWMAAWQARCMPCVWTCAPALRLRCGSDSLRGCGSVCGSELPACVLMCGRAPAGGARVVVVRAACGLWVSVWRLGFERGPADAP